MKFPSRPLRSLAISAACALLAVSALAQAPAPGAPAAPGAAPAATPASKPLGPMEKNFIKNAGKSILYMREVANAAKSASFDQGLARYRDTTASDMKKSWEKLSEVAKAHGETLPAELTGTEKSDVEKLGKLKDDKLAKEWLDSLIKEGKKATKDFESAEKSAQAEDLKMFVINYKEYIRGVANLGEKQEKALKAAPKK